MKRIVLALFLAASVAMPRPGQANMPVIDASNLVQNIMQYVHMIKQLAEAVKQYQVMFDHYKDTVENLKNINPRSLLLGELVGRDFRRGISFLSFAKDLNPNSDFWRKEIEALLRQHYDFLDTDQARYIIDAAFPGQGGDSYRDYYTRRDREMTAVLDTYHFQATQRAAATHRQDHLEKIKRTFLTLENRTGLRQAQATNGFLGIIAQQNEAIIDALQLSMTQQARSEMARRGALDRVIERDARFAERVLRTPAYQCPTTPCFAATW